MSTAALCSTKRAHVWLRYEDGVRSVKRYLFEDTVYLELLIQREIIITQLSEKNLHARGKQKLKIKTALALKNVTRRFFFFFYVFVGAFPVFPV